jgi:hypothetical protein
VKILYFGDPAGGNALLDRGLTLVGVVHGRRGGPGIRRFMPRVKHLPRWSLPDLVATRDVLAALQPDLIVAAFYPQRIPAEVLSIAPGVNVHPSDLPRWRGPDPCVWAIRAGDTETAVCVHWLTSGLDEGDVLRRLPVTIGRRETGGRLAERLQALGAEAVADVAASLAGGAAITAHAQAGAFTWAPLIAAEEWESTGAPTPAPSAVLFAPPPRILGPSPGSEMSCSSS